MTLRQWQSCSGGRIAKLGCIDTTARDPLWSIEVVAAVVCLDSDRTGWPPVPRTAWKLDVGKKLGANTFLHHDTQLSRNSWLGECAHSTLAAAIRFACFAWHGSLISIWWLRKSDLLNPFDSVPGLEVPRRPECRKRRSRGRAFIWQLDNGL